MATLAPHAPRLADNDRFYFGLALAMASVLVAGFGFNFAMGRSTFAVPMVWHLHAAVFVSWVAIFLAQTWFATRGPIALHRRLGWIASFWVVLMVVMGIAITIATIRRGTAPFFFQPRHFLIANPLGLLLIPAFILGFGAGVSIIRRWFVGWTNSYAAANRSPDDIGRLWRIALSQMSVLASIVILFLPIYLALFFSGYLTPRFELAFGKILIGR